jgi:D-alanyl-D-alanine carboxypeptidase/D-alanyl-D-alanine-endopeptidase (penicillin-binding protein 4)
MLRFVLTLLLGLWLWCVPATAQTDIQSQFQALAQRPEFAPATLTFSLRDLATGELVASFNGGHSMVPASTLKLLATSFAMNQFSPEQRWRSQVLLPNPANGGVAKTVVLVGSGDPTLGSDQIEGNASTDEILTEIVGAIQQAGISSIQTLVADTSALAIEPIPRSWTYDDFGNYFGAPVSGLNIHDNYYKLTFTPGVVDSPAAIAGIDPNLGWLEFDNALLTGPVGSGDNGYIFGVPGSNQRWVRGTIPPGAEFPLYGAMPDPANAFLKLLQAHLQAAGISVAQLQHQSTPTTTTGTVLWQHDSPPLLEIVRFLHDVSFNLYADDLLALASQHKSRETPVLDWEMATDIELDWLRSLGVPTDGLRLEDGSGLSRRNLVAADAMTALIRADSLQSWWNDYFNTLKPSLGTVRPTSAARGKSGYITGVRTLSGAIRCQSDRQLAFSVLVNHFQGKSTAVADRFISDFLDAVWQVY